MRPIRNGAESIWLFAVTIAVLTLAIGAIGCGSNGPAPKPPGVVSGPVTVFPGSASVPVSQTVQFVAFLPSAPTATFTWTVSGGSANGTITAGGVYTAPASIPNPSTVTITATEGSGTADTGTATINITAAQGVAVTPTALAIAAGTSQPFTAAVNGSVVTTATWQVNGTTGGDSVHGTINAAGVYTAPLTPPPGGSTTITAISGASSGTATAAVIFSNSSLSGQYAFSYTGKDSHGLLAVAGSFTLTAGTGSFAGVEDYNSTALSAPAQAVKITGTLSVNPDGTASATVNNPAINGTETWQFTLVSGQEGGVAQQGLLVRFDSAASASGTIDRQNPTQLNASSFVGNYVFGFSGRSAKNLPLQIAGKFMANGVASIPLNLAVEDINNNGTTTNGAPDDTLFGSFFMDPNSPDSGRGMLTLINDSVELPGTFNFAFYIVDSTHLKVVEVDTEAFLSGDIYNAPNTNGSFQSTIFTGNYAFTLTGWDIANGVPYVTGGVLVSGGTGAITAGIIDKNDGGVKIQLNTTLGSSSYTVDPNLGRITLSMTIGTVTQNFAAYSTSSGNTQIIELDTGFAASGLALPQSSNAAPQGSFALNLSGLTNASGFPEQDVAGQIAANSTTNVFSGSISVNSAGTISLGVPLINGSNTTSPAGSGRGTAIVKTNLASATYPLAYYTVDGNTVLVLETDGVRIMTGTLAKQF
jgi:hypothetical protein